MERNDPLSIVEYDCAPFFDRKTAIKIMATELQHYTHIVLIDTGIYNIKPFRKRAIANARSFNLRYNEVDGKSLDYFVKLIKCPYSSDEFICLKLGEVVTQDMFLE